MCALAWALGDTRLLSWRRVDTLDRAVVSAFVNARLCAALLDLRRALTAVHVANDFDIFHGRLDTQPEQCYGMWTQVQLVVLDTCLLRARNVLQCQDNMLVLCQYVQYE